MAAIGIASVGVGEIRVRDLCGIDRGLVARWSSAMVQLMPHGGVGVVRALVARLESARISHAAAGPAIEEYPEARDDIEAEMLRTVARAASPLAIDVLLDQPRRWRARSDAEGLADSRVLSRLIEPPLVVAIGAANIGKSTLANTLAGRGVAIVADVPGTTRDHVGVTLDLAGLVVRYVDTPGVRGVDNGVEGHIESEAIASAMALAGRADLVLAVGDPTTPPRWTGEGALRVCLRGDLGPATWSPEVVVSARTGEGIADLVACLRERLVPGEALRDARPWEFWVQTRSTLGS
jgi:hypothetical protein